MKTISDKNKAIASICAVTFLTLVSSATSPALAVIGKNFPEASSEAVASIATLNTLTSVPFTIISGLILGRKVKFRTATFIGLFFTLLGGVMPFFATNVAEILVGRAVLGIGTGISTPVVTCLVLSLFKGDDISKQFSRNSMATNIGAVIFQMLGGILCNYSWRLPFAVYFVVLPVMVIAFVWLPEPKESASTGLQSVKGFDLSKIITKHVMFWSLVHALYMLWFYAYVTQTSGIIVNNGYGDSTVAAIVLSLFTLVGVLGGGMFHKIQKKIGVKTMTLGLCLNGVSFIFLALSKDIVTYTIFSLTFGFGYGLLQPSVSYFLGIGLDDDYRAASISVSTIISSVGSFLSSYAVKYSKIIFNTSWDRIQFVVGSVFFILLGLMFIFIKTPKLKESIR